MGGAARTTNLPFSGRLVVDESVVVAVADTSVLVNEADNVTSTCVVLLDVVIPSVRDDERVDKLCGDGLFFAISDVSPRC